MDEIFVEIWTIWYKTLFVIIFWSRKSHSPQTFLYWYDQHGNKV